jgi:hypothetical protein
MPIRTDVASSFIVIKNGVAWAGYCPMESMVWNEKAKLRDYSRGEKLQEG